MEHLISQWKIGENHDFTTNNRGFAIKFGLNHEELKKKGLTMKQWELHPNKSQEWGLTVVAGIELRVFLKQIEFGHRKCDLRIIMYM